MNRPRSSRQHYDVFRRDYAQGTLDDKIAGADKQPAKPERDNKRRDYLKDHLRWLWPERLERADVRICGIDAHRAAGWKHERGVNDHGVDAFVPRCA
jgi:hypothetical protein